MRKEIIQLTSREFIYEEKSFIYSERLVPYQSEAQRQPGKHWKGEKWKGSEIEKYIPTRVYSPKSTSHNPPSECKLIIFLHGGPGLSIKDPEDSDFMRFFSDLVSEGFTVIAPEIRGSKENKCGYDQPEYDGRLYRKDIVDVIKAFKQQLSPTKTFGIFHSWGGHQGGNALLGQKDFLDGVIHIAGTYYPAARDFYFHGNHFGVSLESLPKYVEGSFEEYFMEYKGMEFANAGSESRERYGNNGSFPQNQLILPIDSIMLDKDLKNRVSYGENIQETPNIPYLIVHCLDDSNVPVSLSTNLYKALLENKKQAYGVFNATGGHLWFKEGKKSFDKKTYDSIFPKIMDFLHAEFNKLPSFQKVDMDRILSEAKIVDIVKKHNAFITGNSVILNHTASVPSDRTVTLNLKEGVVSYLRNYEKLLSKCEVYDDPSKFESSKWQQLYPYFKERLDKIHQREKSKLAELKKHYGMDSNLLSFSILLESPEFFTCH